MDWNGVWDHGNGSSDLGKARRLCLSGLKSDDLSLSSSCTISTSVSGGVLIGIGIGCVCCAGGTRCGI